MAGWRQICGDPDSNAVFTFLIHVDAVLSMQGLSDGQKDNLPVLLVLLPSSTPIAGIAMGTTYLCLSLLLLKMFLLQVALHICLM